MIRIEQNVLSTTQHTVTPLNRYVMGFFALSTAKQKMMESNDSVNPTKHWNCFKGNIGKNPERRGGVECIIMGFPERIDTVWNCELN